MKARHKRFTFLVAGLVVLASAAYLVIKGLNENLNYYFSPTEVIEGKAPPNHVFRLGGLVVPGSLKRDELGNEKTKNVLATFVVTDNKNSVKVRYKGILPDLFTEGRSVVTQGKLGPDGVFQADQVLAKHDEKYMPPEVAEMLKKAHKKGVAEMAGGSKP